MLTELYIKNFAIISEIRIAFSDGLNVLSGETGAGKSIIIGAMSLLLGDRALSDMIRSNEENLTVEGTFNIALLPHIQKQLNVIGCENGTTMVIRRVISNVGKNKIFINGVNVSLASLVEIAESLVNICSQHEHQLLLRAENHIDTLDEFAGLLVKRQEYRAEFEKLRALKEKINALTQINATKAQREEFLKYQLNEINSANLTVGEDGMLENKRVVLANMQKLAEKAQRALALLYAENGSVLEKLKIALADVVEIAKIDTHFGVSPKTLEDSYYQIDDIALSLRDYAKSLVFSQKQFDEIEERMEIIKGLKRKYGATIEEIFAKQEAFRMESEQYASLEEEISTLNAEMTAKEETLFAMANALSQTRKSSAKKLKQTIESEIQFLKLTDAVFEIVFLETGGKLNENGIDDVEFFISTNVGEKIKPLNSVASGGELSRLVLAMKNALIKAGIGGTIVFDEVDSGIGGAVASLVGEKIYSLSKRHQVICITHLPQIACFANAHFAVNKHTSAGQTTSNIVLLDETKSIDEIARMMSGKETTAITRQHAEEMIATAKNEI
ncbi:MAG: DNA repair protein RecN [Deltaproteobacteria bacterium]